MRLAYWVITGKRQPLACLLTFLLWTLLLVGGDSALAAPRYHVAKCGDSLYSVARRYGTTVAALAERNGLKSTAWLQVGQRLTLPGGATSGSHAATLPASVQRAISTAHVQRGRWKHIVIHHSGTAQATIRGMNAYHLKTRHMENGLAYHFIIGNGHGVGDGEIYVGRRWKEQLDGGHLASEVQNHTALGICLVGNFERAHPTTRQLRSLTALVQSLQQRCGLGLSAVMTHRQINLKPTSCPGDYFPWHSFKKGLDGAP